MKLSYVLYIILCSFLFVQFAFGQSDFSEIGKNYITSQSGIFQDNPISSNDLKISSTHVSKQNGVHHIYFQQLKDGIEINQGVGSVHLKDNEVIHATNNFVDVRKFGISTTEQLNLTQAIEKTAGHFNLSLRSSTEIINAEQSTEKSSISRNTSLARGDINSKLVYVVKDNELRLAWNVSFEKADDGFWWNVRVDAATGEIIDKNSWTVECNFDDLHGSNFEKRSGPVRYEKSESDEKKTTQPFAPDSYRVYAAPLEAPTEGSSTLVVDPADGIASPFGWHDTTGVAGHEFTDTRGNNVFAQDDLDANNNGGFRPDGGASLDFDFPADTSMVPSTYLSAAITNLFYWNNLIHDITYQYGFDEGSGNFQQNNYGKGGAASDHVWADAQDGSGTNNANFSTPPDGANPRMQMFEWIYADASFEVTAPGSIDGTYNAPAATFGPLEAGPIMSELVISSPSDGCTPFSNGGAITGKIAVINRGNCNFDLKVGNAENAGALAAVVCDSIPGSTPFSMGGDGDPVVTIPSVMLSKEDCDLIKPEIPTVVSVTAEWQIYSHTDSDFDNGIIAHEYGHGISNRLTGGPGTTSCLNNDEQMGEGWSDFFGMILTMHPGDLGSDGRGVGTYVEGQGLEGSGIRAYRYSTDMTINPHTYDDIKTTGGSPHALGTVWNTMLWDMTWLLIDKHGFDADIYNGTGGNNIAMQLVIDGLKMQGCSPGFIEGRDAILMADTINNGAANSCEIWTAFARRGLGVSADQGAGSNNRTDGTEAFDLPGGCDLNLCTAQDRTFNNETIPNGTDEQTNDFIKTTGTVNVTAGSTVTLTAKNNIDLDGQFTADSGSTVQAQIAPCNDFGLPGSFAPDAQEKSKRINHGKKQLK